MTVDIRLYGILDPAATPRADLVAFACMAARGGATLLQYRDKLAEGHAMVERARAIVAALAGSGVPLLVNDRVDVAVAAGAQGVHLGQTDIAPSDARAMLGPQAIIGRTLKSEAHVRAMAQEPVDYGCIGGVFTTRNKDNPDPPVGLAGLRRLAVLAREVAPRLPVGAIAGIGEANAAETIAAGADGIAVIGAIFGQADPMTAARRLRLIVDEALATHGRAAS